MSWHGRHLAVVRDVADPSFRAKCVQAALGWQLKTPPIPDEILKEGWITKLGAVKQNWKRRYFVATNQARRAVSLLLGLCTCFTCMWLLLLMLLVRSFPDAPMR